MCCLLTWHFSALHTKPSGAQCTRVGACPCLCAILCLCAACSCVHTCVHTWEYWAHFLLVHLPSCPLFSRHTVCDPTVPIGWTERGREGELLQKVHLVCWQCPNYKIVESPCIERIILDYSQLKFKFHFVFALSNGQNCLGEISKGQGELKCLL